MTVQIDGEAGRDVAQQQHRAVAQLQISQQRDGFAVLGGFHGAVQGGVGRLPDLRHRVGHRCALLDGHRLAEAAEGAHRLVVLIHVTIALGQQLHAVAAGNVGVGIHLPVNAVAFLAVIGTLAEAERAALQHSAAAFAHIQSLIIAAPDGDICARRHASKPGVHDRGGHVLQYRLAVSADRSAADPVCLHGTVLHRHSAGNTILDQQDAVEHITITAGQRLAVQVEGNALIDDQSFPCSLGHGQLHMSQQSQGIAVPQRGGGLGHCLVERGRTVTGDLRLILHLSAGALAVRARNSLGRVGALHHLDVVDILAVVV